ncbi:MAG: hypothetical protein ACOX7X_01875 [Methanosarcina flavescens]|jgi:hypothetical protein|uniref:Uncharacterized protein n=1 Tax=Methanosarcina flavescens TaxID=1715806 RepID=A0A7K4ATN2_9EURY|nr:hypothetical protein [Methanosarcina flavescens]NLK32079.1 hypothetical protein [Methanosarcina flavescens]
MIVFGLVAVCECKLFKGGTTVSGIVHIKVRKLDSVTFKKDGGHIV